VAGHSHWAGIKHKKGAADAKRGKIFSKLAKFITVAAREGGGDAGANSKLKLAVEKARAANMPKDNIERAIKKGTGDLGGVSFVELVYEGYAPHNVAVVADILTDNRNRTASELRHLFEKKGGILGSPGAVAWMFETKGLIEVPRDAISEDDLMEIALEAGADDVLSEGKSHQVFTTPEVFTAVREAIIARELEPTFSEVTRIPNNTVELTDASQAKKVLDFITEFEDHDDVQRISANFDIPDELLESLGD